MPSSAMVPGRRFSTTTSALLESLKKTSFPRWDLRSSASDRLFRLRRTNGEDSPSRKGPLRRVRSPPSGFSTLTTSAPRSASCMVQKGAAMKLPTSTTRMPSSAAGAILPPDLGTRLALASYVDEGLPHLRAGRGCVEGRGSALCEGRLSTLFRLLAGRLVLRLPLRTGRFPGGRGFLLSSAPGT